MTILLLAQTGSFETMSYGWLFAKTISIMVAVILLAFLTIKYVLPKLVRGRKLRGSNIEVLDYQPLENRKSVYLLRIEDKKVAVGVTDHAVAKLCEWELHE